MRMTPSLTGSATPFSQRSTGQSSHWLALPPVSFTNAAG
jgi:hypothetical protein